MSKQKLQVVGNLSAKERLVHAAMKLFGERGYDGVSVREIAAEADVSIGLIKHHFGSKEGLRQAVDEFFISIFESFYGDDDGHIEDLSSRETLSTLDNWVAGVAGDWPVFSRYFRRALLEETPWGAELFKRYYDLVRGSIDRLDAQGKIREDADRLWLPFLFIFLETGTLLMDSYIEKILGRSGFESDLWKRRYRAYNAMIARGVMVQGPKDKDDSA
ncbi:MAG: TetR/AcrR family transcriptional regulator [bacterium]